MAGQEQQIEALEDALTHTQDRVMALEAVTRVLAHTLVEARALRSDHLLRNLGEAIQQLHGQYGEEFPQVVRALNVLREFLREVDGLGPVPSPPRRSN